MTGDDGTKSAQNGTFSNFELNFWENMTYAVMSRISWWCHNTNYQASYILEYCVIITYSMFLLFNFLHVISDLWDELSH